MAKTEVNQRDEIHTKNMGDTSSFYDNVVSR